MERNVIQQRKQSYKFTVNQITEYNQNYNRMPISLPRVTIIFRNCFHFFFSPKWLQEIILQVDSKKDVFHPVLDLER